MKQIAEFSLASSNGARLRQLNSSMQQDDVDILRTSRNEVSEFLRLGRKWGFFRLSEEDSKSSGREVLMNAHMPESNLAVLIGGRDPSSLAALEKTIDDGLAEDPKYLARFLISRIDGLYAKEVKEHGGTALNAGNAASRLASEEKPEMYLRWVNVPAPENSVPTWFHVIERYNMGPADLDMIYAEIDRRSAEVTGATVEGVRGTSHRSEVTTAGISAA